MQAKYKTSLRTVTFSNGLRAHIISDSRATEVLCVEAVIHVGGCHDKEGFEGTAHLLEHVLVDEGLDVLEEAGRSRKSQIKGLEYACAKTTHISTEYSFEISTSSTHLTSMFDAIAKFLYQEPVCPKIEDERDVVLSEFADNYESARAYSVDSAFSSNLFEGHPLAHMPIALGSKASICALKADDLIRFHREYYAPVNTSLVLMSNLPVRDIMRALEASVITKGTRVLDVAPPVSCYIARKFSVPFSEFNFGKVGDVFYRPTFALRIPEGIPDGFAELICSVVGTLLSAELREELKISYSLRARIEDYHAGAVMLLIPHPMAQRDFVDMAQAALQEVLADIQVISNEDRREYATHKRRILKTLNERTAPEVFEQAVDDCRKLQRVRTQGELRNEIWRTTYERLHASVCAMVTHGIHTSLTIS